MQPVNWPHLSIHVNNRSEWVRKKAKCIIWKINTHLLSNGKTFHLLSLSPAHWHFYSLLDQVTSVTGDSHSSWEKNLDFSKLQHIHEFNPLFSHSHYNLPWGNDLVTLFHLSLDVTSCTCACTFFLSFLSLLACNVHISRVNVSLFKLLIDNQHHMIPLSSLLLGHFFFLALSSSPYFLLFQFTWTISQSILFDCFLITVDKETASAGERDVLHFKCVITGQDWSAERNWNRWKLQKVSDQSMSHWHSIVKVSFDETLPHTQMNTYTLSVSLIWFASLAIYTVHLANGSEFFLSKHSIYLMMHNVIHWLTEWCLTFCTRHTTETRWIQRMKFHQIQTNWEWKDDT